MNSPNWGKLFADVAKAVAKAVEDAKANKPLPPAAPVSVTPAMVMEIFQTLEALSGLMVKHPGLIRGADDILMALRRDDVPYAAEAKQALDMLPGGIAAAEQWKPTIEYWLNAFQPAPDKFIGIA